MNETAGQSLVEILNKEHGPDRALFLLCNVESEEEIKGNMHTQQNVNGGGKGVCVFCFPSNTCRFSLFQSVNFSRTHQLESQYEQLSAAGAPDHEKLLALHVGVNEPSELYQSTGVLLM